MYSEFRLTDGPADISILSYGSSDLDSTPALTSECQDFKLRPTESGKKQSNPLTPHSNECNGHQVVDCV